MARVIVLLLVALSAFGQVYRGRVTGVVVRTGPPANPQDGDMWYDSTAGKTKCAQGGAITNCMSSEIVSQSLFQHALTERVAWVGIGDSNQLFSGYGWTSGFARVLSERYGLWGTGVHGGGSIGPGFAGSTANCANCVSSGAPVDLQQYMPYFEAPQTLPQIAYLPTGAANDSIALYTRLQYFGGTSAPYRFHYTYGKDPGWSKSLRPYVRIEQSPFTTLVQAPSAFTNTGTGVVDAVVDLPAGTSTANEVSLRIFYNQSGPALITYMQAENLSRQTGFAYNVLGAYEGQPTRVILQALSGWGQYALTEYFRQIRRLLGPHQYVVVSISEGLNDRNDTSPSIGPIGGLTSSTAAGYSDNTQGVINLVRGIYKLNGWDQSGLYFAITPSHPISDPDDANLTAYRNAADVLATRNVNTFTLRYDRLITAAAMTANGWYDNAGSAHLENIGYDGMAALAINSLSTLQPAATAQPISVGATVASAATIALTAPLTHVTGTTAVNTITPPMHFATQGYGGCQVIIPDGAFTWTTSGNIAAPGTAVVGVPLTACYDFASAKYYLR